MRSRRSAIVALATTLLARTAAAKNQTRLLVYGDSIGAGVGVAPKLRWTNLLADRLNELSVEVINASKGGETTGAGRARLAGTLKAYRPTHVAIELGINDALRGLSLVEAKDNIFAMLDLAESKGIKCCILGMQATTAFGRPKPAEQEAMYLEVARERNIPVLPYLLQGIGLKTGAEKYFQADKLHPNDAAQPYILNNVLPIIMTLISQD